LNGTSLDQSAQPLFALFAPLPLCDGESVSNMVDPHLGGSDLQMEWQVLLLIPLSVDVVKELAAWEVKTCSVFASSAFVDR
jgi:hypothetical protein